MRVLTGFILAVSMPVRVLATDWFNDDWEERAAQLSEGELIWYEQNPEPTTSRASLSISFLASSAQHGWVRVEQCHHGLASVPAAQLVFEDRRVRKLKIAQAVNIERVSVEADTVQLTGVNAGAWICVHSEQQVLHRLDDHHWALISGPFQRRFLDGYYPMFIDVRVQWPAGQWRYITSRPANGPTVTAGTGQLHMQAHFAGRLKTALVFQQALADRQ